MRPAPEPGLPGVWQTGVIRGQSAAVTELGWRLARLTGHALALQGSAALRRAARVVHPRALWRSRSRWQRLGRRRAAAPARQPRLLRRAATRPAAGWSLQGRMLAVLRLCAADLERGLHC